MKVRVTYEVTDTQRLAIGGVLTGEFKPATREQIEEYCSRLVDESLTLIGNKLEGAQQQVLSELAAMAHTPAESETPRREPDSNE